MKDTHPAVEEKFYQLMREKSGEERLKKGFEMYDFTRRLVIASLEKASGTMDFFKALLDRFMEMICLIRQNRDFSNACG